MNTDEHVSVLRESLRNLARIFGQMTNRSQKPGERTAICHFALVIGHWSFVIFFSALSPVQEAHQDIVKGVGGRSDTETAPDEEAREVDAGQKSLDERTNGETVTARAYVVKQGEEQRSHQRPPDCRGRLLQ